MTPKTEQSKVAHIATQQYDLVPIEQLKPHPKNARKSDEAALDASIAENGFYGAVVAQRSTGYVLAGWHRTERAKAAGIATLPVIFVDLPDDEAGNSAALRIVAADNRVSDLADYDPIALAELLESVKNQTGGFDGTGFDEKAYDEIVKQAGDALLAQQPEVPDPEPQIDRAAELQKKWKVKRGDLWLIGQHRLLCADSTHAEDIERLMNGERAVLCLTDPPYGIGEHCASFEDTPNNLIELISRFMPLAREHSERMLLTPGNRNQHFYPRPDWTLCWFVSAGTGRSPWGFTCWQPVLAYGKDPYLQAGKGSRPDALGMTESADNSLGHPCSKPLKVWSWFMERGSLKPDDIVLDVFGGSGTSFVAAERLKRRCFGSEISPAYCAVILERMSQMGLTPKLAAKVK